MSAPILSPRPFSAKNLFLVCHAKEVASRTNPDFSAGSKLNASTLGPVPIIGLNLRFNTFLFKIVI